jgi:hypothetical protein
MPSVGWVVLVPAGDSTDEQFARAREHAFIVVREMAREYRLISGGYCEGEMLRCSLHSRNGLQIVAYVTSRQPDRVVIRITESVDMMAPSSMRLRDEIGARLRARGAAVEMETY